MPPVPCGVINDLNGFFRAPEEGLGAPTAGFAVPWGVINDLSGFFRALEVGSGALTAGFDLGKFSATLSAASMRCCRTASASSAVSPSVI